MPNHDLREAREHELTRLGSLFADWKSFEAQALKRRALFEIECQRALKLGIRLREIAEVTGVSKQRGQQIAGPVLTRSEAARLPRD